MVTILHLGVESRVEKTSTVCQISNRKISKSKSKCTSHSYCKASRMSSFIHRSTQPPSDDESKLWIIGVVLAVVALLIVAAVACVILRRKYQLSCRKTEEDVYENPQNFCSSPSFATDTTSVQQESSLSHGGASTGSNLRYL